MTDTTQFFEQHTGVIDRMQLDRFQIMNGPEFLRRFDADPTRAPSLQSVEGQPRLAHATHEPHTRPGFDYLRATQRLLSAVDRINGKPLPGRAAQFDGVT